MNKTDAFRKLVTWLWAFNFFVTLFNIGYRFLDYIAVSILLALVCFLVLLDVLSGRSK